MATTLGYEGSRKLEATAKFNQFSIALSQAKCGETYRTADLINADRFTFALQWFPNGVGGVPNKGMRIELVRTDRTKEVVVCCYGIEVVDESGVRKAAYSKCPREFSMTSGWGFSHFEANSEKYDTDDALKMAYEERIKAFRERRWIKDDTLTVRVSVEIFVGPYGARGCASRPVQDGLHQLQADLINLLESGEDSDITLISKDDKHQAHRFVLSLRSPVFRAMFKNDMAESRSGEVSFADVSKGELDIFLRYLYCGIMPENSSCDELWSVIAIAHKYDVKSLVAECATRLQAQLSPGNAAATLAEADKLGIAALKDTALHFMTSSSQTFEAVQESETYGKLPAELLQQLLAHSMGTNKRNRTSAGIYEYHNGTAWDRLLVRDLKAALGERGLATSGNKAELVDRLIDFEV